METVEITRERFITTAAIRRPEAMNALNFDIMEQLEAMLDELENDPEIRLFILTGTGKSFISGGDLREFHGIENADGAKKMSERMIRILSRIQQLPCWTLAAVNGVTYGGGWETMLAFDFRVAASSATFGFTQGKFYLPPGWGGISALSKAVGKPLATYWLASQKIVDAQTAFQAGLIQDLFEEEEYEEKLRQVKKKLTLNDRPFIEYLKQSQNYLDSAEEIEPFSRFWESEEHRKRVEEFLG
ncbi:MAG: enoyl-CoA hydratase/isomerase family protein [Balneolaceae bacterium]